MLTGNQIVTLACQIANVPGYVSQAQQFLNAVLQELAQDYDFHVIRKTFAGNFNTGASAYSYAPGSGPNPLPPDFLRLHRGGHFYQIFQVPYVLIGVSQEEFDTFVQQPGLASYPYLAYVDVATVPMSLFVWPPASGNYPFWIRYNPQMDDMTDFTQVPWFPNSAYLYTRVAGELMKLEDDERWQAFVGDTDPDKDTQGSACSLLRSYLKMKDNPEMAPKTVTLDRRMFKANIATVRNTKTIGW